MQTENGHLPNFALLSKKLLLTDWDRTMEGELPGQPLTQSTTSNSDREHSQPLHPHKHFEYASSEKKSELYAESDHTSPPGQNKRVSEMLYIIMAVGTEKEDS